MRRFLTAEWRDLILANYEVDPALLASRLPAGTELDLDDGHCFVSLVGFMFLRTRVMGVPVPSHMNFEEVNLRFYVRREVEGEIRRGVVFVKELVPKRAIAFVARTLFGEPYEAWKMRNESSASSCRYEWWRGDERHSMAVETSADLGVPEDNSHEAFIIEHYWGYTRRSDTRTDEYKVEHPKWQLRTVEKSSIEVDFGRLYGAEFSALNGAQPYSTVFAAGSGVIVFLGERLRRANKFVNGAH